MHIVIIGNGAAGNSAASIAAKFNCEVTILSEEAFPEYSACALPYYLSGEIERQHVFLDQDKRSSKENIRNIFGKKVERIIVENQEVVLEGRKLHYDKLIIATGAETIIPRIPGVDKAGVFTFKTLTDVDKILAYDKKKVVIIGAGFIGVEVGIALKMRGCEVILIEVLDRILPRAFDRKPGDIIRTILSEHGIEVLTEERVVQILGRRQVEGIETENRKIKCDTVILSTGMRPRVDLARSAGIEIGELGGIVTNAQMLTNIENIYACGDCVESRDVVTDKNSLQLLWPNAISQGKTAGYNCVGIHSKYPGFVNVVGINVFGTHVASIGHTQAAFEDSSDIQVIEKTYANHSRWIIAKDGAIIGAQFIGKTKEAGVVSQAIWKRTCLEGIEEIVSRQKPLAINPLFTTLERYL
ncbi:MAG: FAD-dependent oxidoreductase [Deltaproteobacteria bacterium]|nr:FAD-dependent oxidoreductase [Deltaproteobacteria bacterium]MBW2126114.1 FAD-dependent oxidoreductase [Deltaproteobacteria bacterium]HDM09930.1 NAD(P)/FAD-dependent oxidoreductase [Desulfobacteraceae bacterium]